MKSLDRDTIGYWPILVNMELDRPPVGRVSEIQAEHLDIFPDLLQSIAGDFQGRLGLDDRQRKVATNETLSDLIEKAPQEAENCIQFQIVNVKKLANWEYSGRIIEERLRVAAGRLGVPVGRTDPIEDWTHGSRFP